jgi:antitoxin HigA-1
VQQYNPPHPGAFINRVYLKPYGLNSKEVASRLKINASTLSRLINKKASVTPELALKLSKVLGRTPESWLTMQNNFNLWKARRAIDLSIYETIRFPS